jgi:hypothetical protein
MRGGDDGTTFATPKYRTPLGLVIGLLSILAIATPAAAQTVEQFYAGRRVNIVVGFNRWRLYLCPGGICHAPAGRPPSSSEHAGRRQRHRRQSLYNVAPRDTSELGVVAGGARWSRSGRKNPQLTGGTSSGLAAPMRSPVARLAHDVVQDSRDLFKH